MSNLKLGNRFRRRSKKNSIERVNIKSKYQSRTGSSDMFEETHTRNKGSIYCPQMAGFENLLQHQLPLLKYSSSQYKSRPEFSQDVSRFVRPLPELQSNKVLKSTTNAHHISPYKRIQPNSKLTGIKTQYKLETVVMDDGFSDQFLAVKTTGKCKCEISNFPIANSIKTLNPQSQKVTKKIRKIGLKKSFVARGEGFKSIMNDRSYSIATSKGNFYLFQRAKDAMRRTIPKTMDVSGKARNDFRICSWKIPTCKN